MFVNLKRIKGFDNIYVVQNWKPMNDVAYKPPTFIFYFIFACNRHQIARFILMIELSLH